MSTQPHLIDRTPDGETVWGVGGHRIVNDRRDPQWFYVWTTHTPRIFVGKAATLEEAAELIAPEPIGAGYYLQCGACDAEVFVTEAQWDDTTVHVVAHEGCSYPDGGVDLDHARRHAD